MSDAPENRLRRGLGAANPILPTSITLWRGEAIEVATGKPPQVDRGIVHDAGPGTYYATDRWLGEVYAHKRYGWSAERRPVLASFTVHRSLIHGPDTLDLTSGFTGVLWRAHMRTWFQRFPDPSYVRHEAYQNILSDFMKQHTGRIKTDPKIIILPDYVHSEEHRQAIQLIVRDEAIQKQIARSRQEVRNQVWIRVLDNRGQPVDVDINDPLNGSTNRRYVEERLRETVRKREQQRRTQSAAPSGPAPPPRGGKVAGALAFLEFARFALYGYGAISNLESDEDRRLREVLGIGRFWRDFGVACMLMGRVRKPGGDLVLTDAVVEKRSQLKGIDLFVGFVPGVAGDAAENPLDDAIDDILTLVAFLRLGLKRKALAFAEDDARVPIWERRWYVRLKEPVRDRKGRISLEVRYFPISETIERIVAKLASRERMLIPKRTDAEAPTGALAAGQHPIHGRSILRFKAGESREIHSTRKRTGRRSKLTSWGKQPAKRSYDSHGSEVPSFHQVGKKNVGDPFTINDAYLVTGANPTTNFWLFDAIVQHDGDAVVHDWENEARAYGAEPTVKSYVNVPLVYVDADEVELLLAEPPD